MMHNIYHDIVGNIVNQRFRHFLNWPNSTGKSMVSHTVGLGLTFHGSQEVYTAESDEDRQPLRRFGKPWRDQMSSVQKPDWMIISGIILTKYHQSMGSMGNPVLNQPVVTPGF